jgi:hypothetical protein
MVLEKDEYFIQDDGIWISKAALEECRDHYCKVADKFKPKPPLPPKPPMGMVNCGVPLLSGI